VVLAVTALAAVTDVRSFRIPNLLTLPFVVTGLAYHGLTGGWGPLIVSFLGALFGFFILLLPFLRGGMGAGDLKLMAGVGAWLGLPMTIYVFIGSGLAGGVYALALLTLFGRRKSSPGEGAQVEEEVKKSGRRRRLVPFALMIALGTVFAFLWAALMGV
jgi:Flp pilus assembly protein protease CpaA